MRKIEIISSVKIKNVAGIYKIMFGSKFYIGYASDIAERMRYHKKEINKSLLLRVINPIGSYKNIKKHIWKRKSFKYATVIILEECDPCFLRVLEREYLKLAFGSKDCLNMVMPALFKLTPKMKNFLIERSLKPFVL